MSVFGKRRYEEWKYILSREKRDFVLELVVSGRKNKGQTKMDIESVKGL